MSEKILAQLKREYTISYVVNYMAFPSGGPSCPVCGEGSLTFCPKCSQYTCTNRACKSYGKQFSFKEVTLQETKISKYKPKQEACT